MGDATWERDALLALAEAEAEAATDAEESAVLLNRKAERHRAKASLLRTSAARVVPGTIVGDAPYTLGRLRLLPIEKPPRTG